MSKLVILFSFLCLSSMSLASETFLFNKKRSNPNGLMPPSAPPPSLVVLNLNLAEDPTTDKGEEKFLLKGKDDDRVYPLSRSNIHNLMHIFSALEPILSIFIGEAEYVSHNSSGTLNEISYSIEAQTLILDLSPIMVQILAFYGTRLAEYKNFHLHGLSEEDLLKLFNEAIQLDLISLLNMIISFCPVHLIEKIINLYLEKMKLNTNFDLFEQVKDIQKHISQEKFLEILRLHVEFHEKKIAEEDCTESLNALGLLFETFYYSNDPNIKVCTNYINYCNYLYHAIKYYKKSWEKKSQLGLENLKSKISQLTGFLGILEYKLFKLSYEKEKNTTTLQEAMKILVLSAKLGNLDAKKILEEALKEVEDLKPNQGMAKMQEILQKKLRHKFASEALSQIPDIDEVNFEKAVDEILMQLDKKPGDNSYNLDPILKEDFFIFFSRLHVRLNLNLGDPKRTFERARSNGDLDSLFVIFNAYKSNEISLEDIQEAFQSFFDYHFDRQDSAYSLYILSRFYDFFGDEILGKNASPVQHFYYFEYQAALKGHRGAYNMLRDLAGEFLYQTAIRSKPLPLEHLLLAEKFENKKAIDELNKLRESSGSKTRKDRKILRQLEKSFPKEFSSEQALFERYFQIINTPLELESFEKLSFKKFTSFSRVKFSPNEILSSDPMNSPIAVQEFKSRPALAKTQSTQTYTTSTNVEQTSTSHEPEAPFSTSFEVLTTPLPEEELAKTDEIEEEKEDDKGKGKEKKKRTLMPKKIKNVWKQKTKVQAESKQTQVKSQSSTEILKIFSYLFKVKPNFDQDLALKLIVQGEESRIKRLENYATEGLSESELEETIEEERLDHVIEKIKRQIEQEEESCTSPEEVSDAPIIGLRKDQIELLKILFQGNPPHLKIENKDVINLIEHLGGDVRGKGGSYFVIRFKNKHIAKYESVHGKDGRHTLTSHYAKRVGKAILKALELGYFTFSQKTLEILFP